MRPWGKSGRRSLNSREFVARTREAFAWEWGAEGGRGRAVAVGSNDWGEQGGAGGREVREGGVGLLGQEGDQAQGPLCSSAPAPRTCTPCPYPSLLISEMMGLLQGPGSMPSLPLQAEKDSAGHQNRPRGFGVRQTPVPSSCVICGPVTARFPPLQKSLPHRAHMRLGSVRACRGEEGDCRHTVFGLLHTSLCPHSPCRDPRSLHALSHFIPGSP